ncbi:hypothetical protein CORC01_14177 [Colletotrichum orchidophilum]|uniref:Uncharacterized protein n=1 Tax=Colletotrichum orchidophilum TaxID=1209926 RepID=A0A1G4AN60_9PEZI|nr:uncharacterized protein CORC01_14177 [Colletotrichum orchidophilum]OHE90525.1 hypothetical protein CORC01_14177 [Colletotrichum orchidophilum]
MRLAVAEITCQPFTLTISVLHRISRSGLPSSSRLARAGLRPPADEDLAAGMVFVVGQTIIETSQPTKLDRDGDSSGNGTLPTRNDSSHEMKLEPPRKSDRNGDLGMSAVDLAGLGDLALLSSFFLSGDGSWRTVAVATAGVPAAHLSNLHDNSLHCGMSSSLRSVRLSGDCKACQAHSKSETTGKRRPIFLASLRRRNMPFSTSTSPRPVVAVVVVAVGIHDNPSRAQQSCRPLPKAKYDSCTNQPVRPFAGYLVGAFRLAQVWSDTTHGIQSIDDQLPEWPFEACLPRQAPLPRILMIGTDGRPGDLEYTDWCFLFSSLVG